jgi:hypothetical protein
MRQFLTGIALVNGGVTGVQFDFIQNSDLPGGSSAAVGADPTATIGTSAVNGVAATFMRSDAAPAMGNLTGNVTSVGLATTIGAGVITNAMLAGGITAANLVGTDITTVGTIGSGVWNGTTIAIARGGTGQTSAGAAGNALSPTTTIGDMEYKSALNVISRVPGNTTATKNFLTQTGTGAASAAPAWGTIAAADVPTLNQSTTGNAATATALQTGRAINGVTFDGTAPITVTAAAGTLTGTTLNSIVTASSLTSVGTLATLTVTATITGSISGNAATVTTNANLTGPITSSGNATAIASQTGTGTKFVMDTSPTLVTPALGTPTSGTLTNCTGYTYANLSGTAPAPRGHIDGLLLSRASVTTIGIAVGLARDSTNAANLSLGSAFTKSTSAWAAGTGNGGLDTGAIGASTWYKVFIIAKTDGTTDIIFTTAAVATGPLMPTGYTLFRYIGSVRTNGSSQFIAFTQIGDKFIWSAPVNDYTAASVTTSFVAKPLTYTPAGISVSALCVVTIVLSSGLANISVISGLADSTQTAGLNPLNIVAVSVAAAVNGYNSILVQTDTTPQIYVAASSASATFSVAVHWYIDPRGRDF